MSFNDNDFKGFRSQQLEVFCQQVLKIKKTPDLVSLVAAEADYINYCRKITNSDEQSRELFSTFCRKNGLDSDEIRIRVSLVATVLGVYKQADYYGILGVAPDADDTAIRKAYRKKAKILHPDKCDGDNGRSDEFIELHAAYSHLRDPELRKMYDAKPGVEGLWVEGTQSATPQTRRPGVGHVAIWLSLLVGGVVIATSGFYINQIKSPKLDSQQNTEAPLSASGSQIDADLLEKPRQDDALTADSDNTGQSVGVAAFSDSVLEKVISGNNDGGDLDAVIELMPKAADTSLAAKTEKEGIEDTEKGVKAPKEKKSDAVKKSKRPGKRPAKLKSKTRAVSKIAKSTQPEEVQRLNDDIDPTVYIVQKERVLSFLKNYTKTYEEGDLNKFRTFFTNNAMEQGQPFESLLPKYQKTFDRIQFLEYKIDLKSLSMEKKGLKIIIDGKFTTRFRMPNNRTGRSSGSIRMELLHEPDGLLVSKMDYEVGG